VLYRDPRDQQGSRGVQVLLVKKGTKDHQDLQDYKDRWDLREFQVLKGHQA
jgi:hypothetical protein